MAEVSYKLYAFVYDTGDSLHKWVELTCTDGSSRLGKLNHIQYSIDDPTRPYAIYSDIGDLQVVDDDNYWGNLTSQNMGLINNNDPAWKDWHFRPIRIDILDGNGNIITRLVTTIDDILPKEGEAFATIKTISLSRRAAEVKADAEQIFNGTNIYGDFGSATSPTLYANRTRSNVTGETKRDWFKHRKGVELLRKTCAALKDDIIKDYAGTLLEPEIEEWTVPTRDERKIVTWHSAPFDYLSGDSVTATCYVNYGGIEYLYLAIRDDANTYSKLYRLDINSNTYSSALHTTDTGYYIRKLHWNSNVNKLYMVECEDEYQLESRYYGVQAKLSELNPSNDSVVTKTLEGFYGSIKRVSGGYADNREAGVWIFTPHGGTNGNGTIIFVERDSTDYGSWVASKTWSIGETFEPSYGDAKEWCYWECTRAGVGAYYEPQPTSGEWKEGETTTIEEAARFTLRMRHCWCRRNCYDIGGSSWSTDLIGSRKPLMHANITSWSLYKTAFLVPLQGDCDRSATGEISDIAFQSPTPEPTYYTTSLHRVDIDNWELHELSSGLGEYGMAIMNISGIEYAICTSPTPDLQKVKLSDGSHTHISDTTGTQAQIIWDRASRVYFVEEGSGWLKSYDGSTVRRENWLFDPGGGAVGPAVQMFDMGIDYSTQGLATIDIASGSIFGVSADIENAIFSFAPKDWGYIDFCDWSGMSIAEVRTAIAKRLGGRWYYDINGKFHFKRITDSNSSVKDFAEGECISLSLETSGRDKIFNRYSYIPIVIEKSSFPVGVYDTSSEIYPPGILVRNSVSADRNFKIVFQAGGSEYKLYGWNSTYSTWDLLTTTPSTATKDVYVVWEYLIIMPQAFSHSTYTAGNTMYFSVRAGEYAHRELTYLDRIEVEDTTSISKYMLREATLGEKRFFKRVLAGDVLYNILQDSKDPHPVVKAVIPWEANCNTISLASVVTFTSAKLGLTSSKKFKVNQLKFVQGTEQILAEITAVNIDIA